MHGARPALAQSAGVELGFLGRPVETAGITIANPRGDQAFNDKVTDKLRWSLRRLLRRRGPPPEKTVDAAAKSE